MAADLGSFATVVAKARVRRLANRMLGHPPQPALSRQRFPVAALPAQACDR